MQRHFNQTHLSSCRIKLPYTCLCNNHTPVYARSSKSGPPVIMQDPYNDEHKTIFRMTICFYMKHNFYAYLPLCKNYGSSLNCEWLRLIQEKARALKLPRGVSMSMVLATLFYSRRHIMTMCNMSFPLPSQLTTNNFW